MSGNLLALLRTEERQLLAELRATPIFQKLEAVRRVLALYSGTGGGDEPAAEDLLLLGRAEEPPEVRPVPPQREPASSPFVGTPANAEEARGTVTAAAPLPPRGLAPEPVAPAAASPAPLLPRTAAMPAPAPTEAMRSGPALPRLAIAEPAAADSAAAVRDGSRAVSAVRAALLAVTR